MQKTSYHPAPDYSVGSEPTQAREIVIELDQLRSLVYTVSDGITKLTQQLEPVIRPNGPEKGGDCGGTTLPMLCPLAEQIRVLRQHLEIDHARLNALAARIEL